MNATGQVAGNVMTLNETRRFAAWGTYSISGQSGSFTSTITSSSTAVFNWASGVRPNERTLTPGLPIVAEAGSIEVSLSPDQVDLSRSEQANVTGVIGTALKKLLIIGGR